ncbi:hypothetical protein P8452_36276 [Trifolium repens]|nr:hypothetical protein P8452_36276 [Trifolium repens]
MDGDQNFSEHSSRPKSYASKTDEEEIVKKGRDSREHRSFRDMVLRDGETEEKADYDTDFEDEDIEEEDGSGIKNNIIKTLMFVYALIIFLSPFFVESASNYRKTNVPCNLDSDCPEPPPQNQFVWKCRHNFCCKYYGQLIDAKDS